MDATSTQLYVILTKILVCSIMLFYLISNFALAINTVRIDNTLKTTFGPILVLGVFANIIGIIGIVTLIILA